MPRSAEIGRKGAAGCNAKVNARATRNFTAPHHEDVSSSNDKRQQPSALVDIPPPKGEPDEWRNKHGITLNICQLPLKVRITLFWVVLNRTTFCLVCTASSWIISILIGVSSLCISSSSIRFVSSFRMLLWQHCASHPHHVYIVSICVGLYTTVAHRKKG